MEEKLLKAKELKDLLDKLATLNGYIKIIPVTNMTILSVHIRVVVSEVSTDSLFHEESFYSYEDDPSKCQLAALRGFFSLEQIEERLAFSQKKD